MSTVKQISEAIALHKYTNIVLTGLIAISIALYIFFANSAVRTLTVLEHSKEDVQVLNVEVSEKESSRLALENGMSIAKAKSMGFIEVDNQTFLIAMPESKALSYRR